MAFQHDIADIKTWDDNDYRYTFIDKQDIPFDYDKFMRVLKNSVDKWTYSKVEKARTLNKIPKENIERYRKNNSK